MEQHTRIVPDTPSQSAAPNNTSGVSPSSPVLRKGIRLQADSFAIAEVLWQGSFGITYFGGDLKQRQYVAIKEFFPATSTRNGQAVVPLGMTEAEFNAAKRRFHDEAQMQARFRHPNIARVLGIFEANNTIYVVMEDLEGTTLQQLVQEKGVLAEKRAVNFVVQIADALKTLHNAGLVHRDIRPDNILLRKDERLLLVDFGTDKKLETKPATPVADGFMSPEQHLQGAPIGTYTNVYALGATLYYLLTGRVPTPAPKRSIGAPLATPEEVNPLISPVTSRAVMQAMTLLYQHRPQSIEEFLELLKHK